MKQICIQCKKQFKHKNPKIGFCSSTCYTKSLNGGTSKQKKSMWKEYWRINRRKQIGYLLTPQEDTLWQTYDKMHNTELFTNINSR